MKPIRFICDIWKDFLLAFNGKKLWPYSNREIALAYLKIAVKTRLFKKLLNLPYNADKIIGFNLSFFDGYSLSKLFYEIFITAEYYFTCDNDKPLIIDCGSNIGISILFFKKLYPNSKIIAFEPDERAFLLLNKNIKDNNIDNISVYNKAVMDKEDIINFYYDPQNPGSLLMSTIRERQPQEFIKVGSTCLSKYIEGVVDFLKMDVEGAETTIIEELYRTGKINFIKKLIVEYHHHISPQDDNLSHFLRIIEDSGFGYQINNNNSLPFSEYRFQDILIYAYSKLPIS